VRCGTRTVDAARSRRDEVMSDALQLVSMPIAEANALHRADQRGDP
jgi:hypothetical protein